MSAPATQFLSRTWDRDRVMAIAQFLPMVLDGPLQAIGKKDLCDSLTKLGALADKYRTVTRFSGLLDVLSSEKVMSVVSVRDANIRRLGTLEHICHVLFFPFEHLALLNSVGVLKSNQGARFGGLAVFFWFWGLLLADVRQLYQMLLAYPHLSPKATDAASLKRQTEWKRLVLSVVKTTCFLIFSLTCLPAKGKPQLLASPSGVLLPLHRAVEMLSPSHLNLGTSARGMLGLIASVVDFM